MKKTNIFLWSYLGIVLLAAFLLTGSLQAQRSATETISQPETTQYFMVRAQGDQVIVCKNDQDIPFMELDISLHTLPKFDQEQIKMGLRLENMTALEQFLEDFEG